MLSYPSCAKVDVFQLCKWCFWHLTWLRCYSVHIVDVGASTQLSRLHKSWADVFLQKCIH